MKLIAKATLSLLLLLMALPLMADSSAHAPVITVNSSKTEATPPPSGAQALTTDSRNPHVALIKLDMMILPGTQEYLEKSIQVASDSGAKVLIVQIDTPGGMLHTTQQMIQAIFRSPVPIVFYVSPTGGTATSAGVFLTLAGHVAAMAPGTSIGAAHPVAGDGKDIEGDMRAKAENMTIAMIKSISDERGRNVEWAEKSVKDSSSLTEREALKIKVVDIIASDIGDLLKQLKGHEVKVGSTKLTLEDYSSLPRVDIAPSFRAKALNFFADPNILALLWLGGTTGLSLELYNPGAVLPGVVGIICLILALLVSQVIPVSEGAIALMLVGALLIGAEFYVTSGVLGIGGVIAMVLGAIYLIDLSEAPGVYVAMSLIIPVAAVLGFLLLIAVRLAIGSRRAKLQTGNEGIVGAKGKAMENITGGGRVFVNGEYWKAVPAADVTGVIEKGAAILVSGVRDGLTLEVRRDS